MRALLYFFYAWDSLQPIYYHFSAIAVRDFTKLQRNVGFLESSFDRAGFSCGVEEGRDDDDLEPYLLCRQFILFMITAYSIVDSCPRSVLRIA
jgi:hypothetical protein